VKQGQTLHRQCDFLTFWRREQFMYITLHFYWR